MTVDLGCHKIIVGKTKKIQVPNEIIIIMYCSTITLPPFTVNDTLGIFSKAC